MRRNILWIVLVLLPLGLVAQEQEADGKSESKRSASHVFTGFSGGMMLHAGYLFSDNPTKVFSNTGLGSSDYVKGLPKSGACFGLGGALRVHLIDHIHLGAEGFVSTMPLMSRRTSDLPSPDASTFHLWLTPINSGSPVMASASAATTSGVPAGLRLKRSMSSMASVVPASPRRQP